MGKHIDEPNKSIFKKFLIIYAIILTVVMLIFLGYVADSLIRYEQNQIENYMANVINELRKVSQKDQIEQYIDTSKVKVSEYENSNTTIDEGFCEILQTQNITYKFNEKSKDDNKPVYDIFAGKEKILQVTLDGTKTENRLGLLTFNIWKVTSLEPKMEKGLYTCNILVPNNLKVYVNDKELTEEHIIEKVQDEGLEEISKYVKIPYIVKYEVTELLKQPKVKLIDENGKEVQYKQEGNKISKELDFITAETEEEAMKNISGEIDVLKVAKDWSLYLTDDLSGKLNGYYNISKYLIDGSVIKKFAYSWATGIDITFVSGHTLLNPTFTNEKISNFEIYNENAFSCEVYLQKNLKLKNGKIIEDKMNEKMYFAYYDETDDGKDNPEWKLVNMQSVTDNSNNIK